MGAFDNLTYAFGGDDPNAQSNLELRRRIALSMLSQKKGFPKTLGEGLTAVGDAIGDRGIIGRIQAEDAAANAAGNAFDSKYASADPTTNVTENTTATDTTPRAAIPPPADQPPAPTAQANMLTTSPQPPSMLRTQMPRGLGGQAPAETPQQTASYMAPQPAMPPPAVAATSPAESAPAEQLPYNTIDSAGLNDPWAARSRAVAGIESSGQKNPYATHGSIIPKSGDRAYGKYQVMGKNIPQWTKEATGTAMTPAQFLADPNAQEATFRVKFGHYIKQYGEEGAAKAWFAGETGMKNPNATDVHGRLTTSTYGQDYMKRLNASPPDLSAGGNPRDNVASLLLARGEDPAEPGAAGGAVGPSVSAFAPTASLGTLRGGPAAGAAAPPGLRAAPPPVRVAQGPDGQPVAVPGYVTPDPGPVVQSIQIPPTKRAIAIEKEAAQYRGNPYIQEKAQKLLAKEEERRAFQQKQMDEEAKRQNTVNDQLRVKRQEQLADQAKRLVEHTQAVSKAQIDAENADITTRTGGMAPADFYKRMDTDKAAIDQTVRAQDAQRLARKAIRDGVITGYGANMQVAGAKFLDWAFKNGMQGNLAANTEIMKAALDTGLSEAIKTVNGEGGAQVSNTDVKIAQGIQGSSPELQMKTIQAIMDRAADINHRKIDRYEQKVEHFLSGKKSELQYQTDPRPIDTPERMQLLATSQADPVKGAQMRAFFDEIHGPGAAALELSRIERARRRRGG